MPSLDELAELREPCRDEIPEGNDSQLRKQFSLRCPPFETQHNHKTGLQTAQTFPPAQRSHPSRSEGVVYHTVKGRHTHRCQQILVPSSHESETFISRMPPGQHFITTHPQSAGLESHWRQSHVSRGWIKLDGSRKHRARETNFLLLEIRPKPARRGPEFAGADVVSQGRSSAAQDMMSEDPTSAKKASVTPKTWARKKCGRIRHHDVTFGRPAGTANVSRHGHGVAR